MVIRHHFVWVHGLMHGAWCWYKTVDLLRRAGRRVATLDLASCGTLPADPNTISEFAVYNQPLSIFSCRCLKPTSGFFHVSNFVIQIVLVGHSMAGFSVSDAMERFHDILKAVVYISAVLMPSGKSFANSPSFSEMVFKDRPATQGAEATHPPTSGRVPKSRDCMDCFTTIVHHSIVLHVAGGQDVVLREMLSRPYPAGAMMMAAITYTNEKHGTVPSVYIKCLQDKVIVPEVQDFLIELNQISQVIEMESDHSPMLSAPEKLHQILLATADEYA
ncbi:unnamed protein product [Sphagnum balticum]